MTTTGPVVVRDDEGRDEEDGAAEAAVVHSHPVEAMEKSSDERIQKKMKVTRPCQQG